MEKENDNTINTFMTSIIEKVIEMKKDEKLEQYISETFEKCKILSQGGLPERALMEVQYLIINLAKQFDL